MSSTALFRTEAETAKRGLEQCGPIFVDTTLGKISLHLTDDWANLQAPWEALHEVAACSAAQTYDWARGIARHVLGPEGREAVIAVGYGTDGAPLLLWPFEMAKTAGMPVLSWLGHDHANYNMGLFAPDAAERFNADDISRLLGAVGREAGASAAVLTAQPEAWDGIPNPFAKLPHQVAPNSGSAVKLGDFDTLFKERFSKRSRSTLNRKERKLLELQPLAYGWAETTDERLALMDVFFAQKTRQFAEMGVKNVFDVHARAFYREVALLEGDNPSRLHLGFLKAGDDIAATFSGTVCHNRMAVSLSSLAEGEVQRYSPGGLLLRQQIEEFCEKGLALYDMGVGEARHKTEWCEITQPLFDSFIALKPQGLILTQALAVMARGKRVIKTNRHLWPLVQRWRRTLLARKADGAGTRSTHGGDAAEEA